MSSSRFYASAPVRLDFAGGWTDVAPFSIEVGGAVVNAAIDLRASAMLAPGGTTYRLHATDIEQQVETDTLRTDGPLRLHQAALQRGGVGPCLLRTTSNAPVGSGLGSSGALGVSLVAAIGAAAGVTRLPEATAEEAWQVEAVDARLAGGRQDQYAAALGGFNHLRFTATGVQVDRLALDPAFRAWLGRHTVICYTGASRLSSRMISRVMDGYAAGDPGITAALRGLASVAAPMARSLLSGDGKEVGRLLSANWRYQIALDPGMKTAEMARLEDAMERAGSLGGKAAGAGAGGCMFFLCDDPERARAAARDAGARVLSSAWEDEGVQAWRG